MSEKAGELNRIQTTFNLLVINRDQFSLRFILGTEPKKFCTRKHLAQQIMWTYRYSHVKTFWETKKVFTQKFFGQKISGI